MGLVAARLSRESGITGAGGRPGHDRRGGHAMPVDIDDVPADQPEDLNLDAFDRPWPPAAQGPRGHGPLEDVRWQRQVRPRWQRIAFTSMLAVLLALLLDPSRVLFAGPGLAIAAVLWPVLGWPGRIVTW